MLAQAFFAPMVFAQDSPSTSESELTSSSEISNGNTNEIASEDSSESSSENSNEDSSEEDASENGGKKSRRKSRAEKKSESAENVSETPAEEKSEKTLITIMNALVSGNKKDEASGDDLLTFECNVKISVEKGAVKTIISADKVSFNRAREMLFAEGAVRLEQTEKNGSTQTVTSDTLLFNTATLEGVFDNSRVVRADSNALNLPSGSKISVYSDIFARDDSGTIAFKNGKLTFCDDDENPHWTIRASRIWLLPGNEFAFLNGLIYVGAVPVFYLPAFYYPKDELIFNPVFGYRNRAGFYFQTTTYLYGRKPLENSDDSDSKEGDDNVLADYFSLIKPTKLMDQVREGIVLHNLDTEYKGDTTDHLKFMIDWYSNLGFSTGIDGVFHPKSPAPSVEASFVFGFSNSVFQESSSALYMPYGQSGTRYKDKSNFMGVEMPFRYKGGVKISGSQPFTYSLDIPIYSDPFFNYDFADRSETMDWFSYLLDGPTQENGTKTELEKFEAAEITSFSWNSNISYSVKLPDAIKPYLESLSLSSFNSTILFAEKDAKFSTDSSDEDGWREVTPTRKFFYPSTITPLKFGLRAGGTIFSTSAKQSAAKKSEKSLALELNTPDLFSENSEEDDGEEKDGADDSDELFEGEGLLPTLDFSRSSLASITQFSYDLKYSFDPDFTSQISYASEPLNTADDFDWNKTKSSYIQFKAPLSFDQSLSYQNNFLGMKNSLKLDPLYQRHPYISDDTTAGGYSESSKKSLQETDYKASYFDIVNTNTVSFKPFVYYPNFKDTGISWNTSIKLLRTEFIGDAENPDWDFLTVDWSEEESLTSHTLNATLAANELGEKFSQSLVLTATLPPQVNKYYATLNLKFPYVSFSAETGFSQTSLTDDTWKKEPFKESLSVNLFGSEMKITQSFNYEIEEEHADSFKAALSYKGRQAASTMRYTNLYDFDEETGWSANSEKDFVPYSASIAYASTSKKFKTWKNRIEVAPGLDTSFVYDFVRPTNSYFIFSPSLTFRLNKAFYLKFSATSRNDVVYRYFQKAAGYEARIDGETNPIVDLINGFRFDDEELRKSSGFKLKSLEITMMHDLHDWDFKCRFKVEPRLVTESGNKKHYDFSPYFSLSVVWRPMDSFKTKIEDKYGEFILNGSDDE